MAKVKPYKIILSVIAGILALIILVASSYLIYICAQYYRIEDNQDIQIKNNQTTTVSLEEEYSIATYNIGFGAYTHDFSFFMDSGERKNGEKVTGKDSVAKDKATVETNTTGSINTIKEKNVDFALFQEVDIEATRSHKYNQLEHIEREFPNLSSSTSLNFHSAFLFYPIFEPHGKTTAGIVTLSKYNISKATRRSLPIDESFPTKFFDLDRCIQVTRLPISSCEKELVIINAHLSAYDEGGIIRKQQLEFLNNILAEEYSAGNYVVVGGDFNHDIANSSDIWESDFKKPEWVYSLDNSNLTTGYRFVSSTNAPTCRATDINYIKGETYTVVIDGFICSDNVETVSIENIDTDFMYSDHNPSLLKFKLKTI
ncbi:MAG: endonuclease [Clostridiales bacterium]|nr:endonuclease [Clostridiales bacterium]